METSNLEIGGRHSGSVDVLEHAMMGVIHGHEVELGTIHARV